MLQILVSKVGLSVELWLGYPLTTGRRSTTYSDGDPQAFMILFEEHHLPDGAHPLALLQRIWLLGFKKISFSDPTVRRNGGRAGVCQTYMSHWGGQRLLWVTASSACPDDRFMAVEVDLCLQLIPQLIMGGSLHISTQ